MKKYERPTLEVINLSVKENIAALEPKFNRLDSELDTWFTGYSLFGNISQ